MVDDREDHRLPIDTGQGFHEVEADVRPDDGGDRQWHEEAGRVEVLGLVSLTSGTCPHKVLHKTPHVGEVEVAAEAVHGALHTLVAVLVHRL